MTPFLIDVTFELLLKDALSKRGTCNLSAISYPEGKHTQGGV